MGLNEKIEIILKHVDSVITVPSYMEEDVKVAIRKALVEAKKQAGYTLELSLDELLLLKNELGFPSGYEWVGDVYASLHQKLGKAYSKPIMTQQELDRKVNSEMENMQWDKSIEPFMRAAEVYRLEFYNDIVD